MCKTLHRIKQFIDYKGLSVSAFEKSIGMSNASFGKSLKNKGAIGTDKLENILAVYPELSPSWLLTGRGDMLLTSAQRDDEEIFSGSTEAHPVGKVAEGRKFSTATRPRIPLTAAAGELAEYISPTSGAECERFPVVTSFARYDFTIIIEGDSMAPDYLSGDELACALVDSPADIKWGRPYVLDTDRGIVFKRIYDGGDSIMCTSINPSGPSFIVDKADIHHIAAVVGYLRAAQ